MAQERLKERFSITELYVFNRNAGCYVNGCKVAFGELYRKLSKCRAGSVPYRFTSINEMMTLYY